MGEDQTYLDTMRPIDYIIRWFRKAISSTPKSPSDRIVVANSTTGSGKSTVMPTELFLAFPERLRKVYVTQPRVVTAIDIPKTIIEVPVYAKKFSMGKNIGYQTGDYKMPVKGDGITFCTVGVLLQQLVNSPPLEFCARHHLIILDEAHDRSIPLDLVFMYMKKLLGLVPLDKFPFLILTSGTMDTSKYTSYFSTNTVFDIKGDSYPIQTKYLEFASKDYIQSTVDAINHIHDTQETDMATCDIVVFMPTTVAIKKIKQAITQQNEKREKGKIMALSLDSATFKEVKAEYVKIFKPLKALKMPEYSRKVLIGTNAIETGITLPSVSYCVDSGLVNTLEHNPPKDCDMLFVRPVTQSMALQRRGRVGRIRPGVFMPMYTEGDFMKFQTIQTPEIILADIAPYLLKIMSLENLNASDLYASMDMMDSIPRILVTSGLAKLHSYGLIDSEGEPIKNEGLVEIFSKLNKVSFGAVYMVVISSAFGVSMGDAATIAAFISVGKNLICSRSFAGFVVPFRKTSQTAKNSESTEEEIDYKAYNRLKAKAFISCDFVEWLLFFYRFRDVIASKVDTGGQFVDSTTGATYKSISEFCKGEDVELNGMMAACLMRDEIMVNMKKLGLSYGNGSGGDSIYDSYIRMVHDGNDTMDFVKACLKIKRLIHAVFDSNSAKLTQGGKFYRCKNQLKLFAGEVSRPYSLYVDDQNGDVQSAWIRSSQFVYDKLLIRKNAMTSKYEPVVVSGISGLAT
jgi:HrpA-like RNA helicase